MDSTQNSCGLDFTTRHVRSASKKRIFFQTLNYSRDVGLLLFDIKASLAIQRRWKSSFLPRKYLRKKSSTRTQYTKMFLKSPILKIGKWLHQRITNHFVLLDVKPNVVVLNTNNSDTYSSNWNRFKRFHSFSLCNEECLIKSFM